MTEKENPIDYSEYIRPYSKNFTVRVDEEMYRNTEILRAYYSNEMVQPSNTDIWRLLLQWKVNELRGNNKEFQKIMDIDSQVPFIK